MTPFTLRIHSFVDLITNSSSELFVAANQQTISTVKAIINQSLRLAGSNKSCDDLLDIQLKPSNGYTYDDDELGTGGATNLKCVALTDDAHELARLVNCLKSSFGTESLMN